MITPGPRRIAAAALVVGAVVAGAGCSNQQLASTGITESDAYKIGCPAVDSALATGSVANKAAVAGLEGVRDHAHLDADSTKFVGAALSLLRSAKPSDVPADARKLIIDGCKKHGYTLQNLK